MKHALAGAILALMLAAPLAVAAQTAPGAASDLNALTNTYFNAILHNDVTALSGITSPTFHAIDPDGARLDFNAFMYTVSTQFFRMLPPEGIDVKIKGITLAAAGATEDVATLLWFSGVSNPSPMDGPIIERDFGTHQLTWHKTASGKWLLDEDHLTALSRT